MEEDEDEEDGTPSVRTSEMGELRDKLGELEAVMEEEGVEGEESVLLGERVKMYEQRCEFVEKEM